MPESAVCDAFLNYLLDSFAPVGVHLVEDFLHFRVALAAEGEFLHDEQHLLMMFQVETAIRKLLAEAVEGRKP